MSVEAWIEERASRTSIGAQASRVLGVLASQSRFASYATARQVADQAGVNISTVTRTAQGLGFTGWPDLQLELRHRYLGGLTANEILTDHTEPATDPIMAAFRSDAANLAVAASTLDLDTARAVAAAIRTARRTLVIASGSYLTPAIMLTHIAGLMGLDIDYDPAGGTARASRITRMGRGDCLIAINVWRLPREILQATRLAHDRGITTCVITDRRATPLTDAGDHVLIIPSEGASLFPSLTAAVALVHGILNQIVATDTERVRAAVADSDEAWRRLDLMEDQPTRT